VTGELPAVTAVDLFNEWWPWVQAVALVGVFGVSYLVGIKS
jgi:hypothetical protein